MGAPTRAGLAVAAVAEATVVEEVEATVEGVAMVVALEEAGAAEAAVVVHARATGPAPGEWGA